MSSMSEKHLDGMIDCSLFKKECKPWTCTWSTLKSTRCLKLFHAFSKRWICWESTMFYFVHAYMLLPRIELGDQHVRGTSWLCGREPTKQKLSFIMLQVEEFSAPTSLSHFLLASHKQGANFFNRQFVCQPAHGCLASCFSCSFLRVQDRAIWMPHMYILIQPDRVLPHPCCATEVLNQTDPASSSRLIVTLDYGKFDCVAMKSLIPRVALRNNYSVSLPETQ